MHVPIFDADNHMYETKEAFTKFLPKRYQHAVRYVDVEGRTKIAINGRISEYIPNPTFDVVARPGRRRSTTGRATPTGRACGRSSASRSGPSRGSARRRRGSS